MRRIRFLAIALISFFTVAAGSLLHRAIAVFLCGILGVNASACYLSLHNRMLAAEPPTTAIAQQTKQAQGAGEFKITYGPVKSEIHQKYQRLLQQTGEFEVLAQELNKINLAIPVDVPIILTECGQKNAFYINTKNLIVICNDLTLAFAETFYTNSPNKPIEDILHQAQQVTTFIVLHEVGHALIHLLNLPATGREEDAVDELASVLLLEAEDEASEKAVLHTAVSFLLQGQQNLKPEEIPFWDEHSLDMQRFYTLACLLYGKNPGKYSRLVQQKILPEARAARCENEYVQKRDSWTRLLEPHINTVSQPGNSVTPQPVNPNQYPPQNPNPGTPNPDLLW